VDPDKVAILLTKGLNVWLVFACPAQMVSPFKGAQLERCQILRLSLDKIALIKLIGSHHRLIVLIKPFEIGREMIRVEDPMQTL